ncbi:hypothetical protein BDV23DRAFT_179467 [Aspergillus alliaceus]|uniref:Uncharacterized protein n=1 Tax=Petromyces alliaceus TaxID=209559 RepID=A0A5N7CM07_PETAA|nr:uncharacterized protein BDW43DRAFT_305437 [Aspergillus alliaceus]KAB8239669.1 hypothetical protein BDW43DRAFT_305437 [Aspergillus alliaceus]KAE8394688.1 hypothetical protein BDV23DRAFT_179467 [Aspergillus alliaceus]
MMFLPLHNRSLVPRSSDSSTTPIIVGVVLGCVVAIAITAGTLFILLRKRRWYRVRRYEEEMLSMRGPTGYKRQGFGFPSDNHQPRPHSSMHSYSQPQEQSHTHPRGRLSGDTPPPAYTTIPAYDPSKYHTISQLPPTMQINRPMQGNPIGVFEERPFSFIRGVEQQYTSPAETQRSSSHAQHRGPSPEGAWSMESESSTTNFSRPLEGVQSPRRPKPVLTKLVTNFV